MTRCPAASSGCNGPREAQCMGLCADRINTHHLPDDRAAIVLGHIEPAPAISRARLALNTFGLYRRAGCGLHEASRNALRAWRQRT